MTAIARGSFTVELKPLAEPDSVDGVSLGRMSIDKSYTGDIVGTSGGQMLSAMTPVAGSAGYVAIERISGTLHDQAGTFALQHAGTMQGEHQELSITIVPDSGTGALAGIQGTMKLTIVDGKHDYELEYSLSR